MIIQNGVAIYVYVLTSLLSIDHHHYSPKGVRNRDELVFTEVKNRGIPIVMLTSGGYQVTPSVCIILQCMLIILETLAACIGWFYIFSQNIIECI